MNPVTYRIRKFKKDLRNEKISSNQIIRKYIYLGTPYVFEKNEDLYFDLKEEIAEYFKINPLRIIMVGSAKLGFSISPRKPWKHITNESDIDITIIDEKIFDEFWKELFEFNIERTPRTKGQNEKYKDFLDYLFKGWIRPDVFPFDYKRRIEWFNFLKSLYNKYDNRKVSAGIFRNEYFFENYQISNIKNISQGVL